MRIRALAIGLALAWATIGGARAAAPATPPEVLFTITNTHSGKTLATFELPLNSAPLFELQGVFVSFPSVPVTVGKLLPTPASVTFWNLGNGGGFVTDGFFFSGPQFYAGLENNPTFVVPKVYTGLANKFGGIKDTVTVSELMPDPPPALAAPELSTWAMLLLGFVGLSYASYKKAKKRTTLPA